MRIRYRGVLWTFLAGSFGGWIFDSAYRSVYAGALVLSGPTYPPFYPSYGFGTLLLLFAVRAVAQRPLAQRALAYAAITSLWELAAGLVLQALGLRLWDYSNNPFQLLGHIDLEHGVCWTALAFVFERALYPRLAPRVFVPSASDARVETEKAA